MSPPGSPPSSSSRFARALVKPYVPDIQRINASVEEVRRQQAKVVTKISAAKAELKWCTQDGDLGRLEATMDLVPHYAYKAQQCARDMHQLSLRIAKVKEKAIRLARVAEKRREKQASKH